MKIARSIAVAFAVFSGVVPAAAQNVSEQRFDLACSGGRTDTLGWSTPTNHRFRIDLVAHLYCDASCETVQALVENGSLLISSPEHVLDSLSLRTQWDRPAGTFQTVFTALKGATAGRVIFVESGTCEKRTFSGFPDKRR